MEIYVTKDYQELSETAADIIADTISDKPGSVLGLAAGADLEGLYAELVKRYSDEALDFSRVATFNVGEYCGLTPDDEQSCSHFIQESLLKHINIHPESTHTFNAANTDVQAMCDAYEAEIMLEGGINLQLLDLGCAGQLGFNDPADEFSKETLFVDLEESAIQDMSQLFGSVDAAPRQALTMGIGTIMTAKQILLVVSGEDKAQIVRDAFFGPVTPRVPASILQFHPNALAVVDEAAFSCCGDVPQVSGGCACGHHHDEDEECCHNHHEDEECCHNHHDGEE